MKRITVDASKGAGALPHYWEACVGSCHGALALREDWRRHLRQCREELGFRSVRFHGILDDDLSVVVSGAGGEAVYSFFNIDGICDFLLSIGMKPFVELGFMPTALASGRRTVFHYAGNITPPADYRRWAELVERLVRHLVARYGAAEVRSWPFEVWNEPNLDCFWAGSRDDYFALYRRAAEAIKAVDPGIPVGGPATARNAWIPETIEYCEAHGVPLDFISTHQYPTDAAIGSNLDVEAQMAAAGRGVLRRMVERAVEQAGSYPVYYTEWNSSPSDRDPHHDMPFAAPFVTKTVVDNLGLVDVYSYWTFSDVFEESGMPSAPFHGGFGLLTLHGVPKPSYRAFQLLHALGTERLAVKREGGGAETLELCASRRGDDLVIVAYNHDVPGAPIAAETVTIELRGVRAARGAFVERIDEEHANPRRRWVEMGSPEYPDSSAVQELVDSSRLQREPLDLERVPAGLACTLTVPAHGVAAITLLGARPSRR